MPEKIKGVVTSFLRDDGIGAISPTDGTSLPDDVVFYRSSVNGDGYGALERGIEVEFELCPASAVRGVFRSFNVTVIGCIPCSEARLKKCWDRRMMMNSLHLKGQGIDKVDQPPSILSLVRSFANTPTTPIYIRGSNTTSTPRQGNLGNKKHRERSFCEVIDLITPTKSQDDESSFTEDFDDLCMGESLSAEDAVAQRVKEAEENGDVIDLMSPIKG